MTGRAVLAIAGAAAALATGGCGSSVSGTSKRSISKTEAPPTRLLAVVSTTGHVTLTTSKGRPVTRLPSGWYTVLVRVNSTHADFHMIGPSVSSTTRTGVPSLALWGVHLIKGMYRYMNDQNARGAAHVFFVY